MNENRNGVVRKKTDASAASIDHHRDAAGRRYSNILHVVAVVEIHDTIVRRYMIG